MSAPLLIEQMGRVSYKVAHDRQLELVEKLFREKQGNDVCLIGEHEPVFTLGRHGKPEHVTVSEDFLHQRNIELVRVERGGEVTWHGPGQLVCYPLINLRRRRLGVAEYVHLLEGIMLKVVERFGIGAAREKRNHGIWCGEKKIGSVGIAVRHGISFHGLALNVHPDLEPFSWINPCGLADVSMGSMAEQLQQSVDIKEVESVMIAEVERVFGHRQGKKQRAGRKPKWLRQRLPKGGDYEKTRRLVRAGGLRTVCQEARCPNQFECFGKGTATFMLMGESCTRNCRFCAVSHGDIKPLDPDEPEHIAKAVADLNLKYAVLTSVTRDDLADGGAAHFAATIKAIRRRCPETRVEILIPDLKGNREALVFLCEPTPAVLNHNVETVPSLYPRVRPQAVYERSLELLRRVRTINPHIVTKSGLMLGLGETREELVRTMSDIRETGCELLTLGQYLQPTTAHLPVTRYLPPEEFEDIRETGLEIGFAGVAAGPHVRSSYQAEELYNLAQ